MVHLVLRLVWQQIWRHINLTEVIDGTSAYIDNREITIDELTQYIKAPDFPTGGTMLWLRWCKTSFRKLDVDCVVLRAKTNFEEVHGRDCIIATEIRNQVNKADMIAKTAELVKDGN